MSICGGGAAGTVMFKIGREEPVASMDSSGKIIWARHNEVQTVNVKAVPSELEVLNPPDPRPPKTDPWWTLKEKRNAP